MFKRRAYDDLLRWKRESRGARALLLEGARRVGKSTLAREFAEREYAAHLVIDFSEASDDLKMLFRDYRADVDSFFMYLQAFTGVSLPRRNSLIVFDEVQRGSSSNSLSRTVGTTTSKLVRSYPFGATSRASSFLPRRLHFA